MGIINVTPDSFSDGGRYCSVHEAVSRGLRMTRPGAEPIDLSAELARVIPVVERLASLTSIPISIDTTKAEVARRALEVGASIINDISALTKDPAMIEIAASSDAGLVLMHMRGEPRSMQQDPEYTDVVAEVGDYLRERLEAVQVAGIDVERIVLDPGIGFAKTFEHNLELFRRMGELAALPRPLLVGPSRKAFLGKILDLPPALRVEGTSAAVAAAIMAGARIVRVHDVRSIARVVRVAEALAPWQLTLS
jgi:dihydropteroate synthase